MFEGDHGFPVLANICFQLMSFSHSDIFGLHFPYVLFPIPQFSHKSTSQHYHRHPYFRDIKNTKNKTKKEDSFTLGHHGGPKAQGPCL
jgi:hypothetical protein